MLRHCQVLNLESNHLWWSERRSGAVGALGVVPVRAPAACNLTGGFPHGDARSSRAAGPQLCAPWTGRPPPSDPSEDSPPPCPPLTGDLHRWECTFTPTWEQIYTDTNRHCCSLSVEGILSVLEGSESQSLWASVLIWVCGDFDFVCGYFWISVVMCCFEAILVSFRSFSSLYGRLSSLVVILLCVFMVVSVSDSTWSHSSDFVSYISWYIESLRLFEVSALCLFVDKCLIMWISEGVSRSFVWLPLVGCCGHLKSTCGDFELCWTHFALFWVF